MKNLIIYVLLALPFIGLGQTPSQTQNYIMTTTYQKGYVKGQEQNATNKEKITAITYLDGLGRPIQNVGVRAGGQSQDIITFIDYDIIGRQDKDYLPYTATSNGGAYRIDALNATNSFYFIAKYETTTNPYSEKHFEDSPLNRVVEQGAPGSNWLVNKSSDTDHTIKFEYKTNTTTNEVRLYTVSLTTDYTPTLNSSSYYPNNSLYKTTTKDENWTSGTNHTTEEFKDKQGRVVLKRSYNNGPHDTFYVYDDYGNLTYVLPPKVIHDSSISTTELSELCYQYKYDKRNRLIEKKIPGKGWEYIIYDNLDRPVLTQDENQRSKSPNEWLFTKYDQLGRVAYTGIHTNTLYTSRTSMQGHFDSQNNTASDYYENRATSSVDYDNSYYYNTHFPTLDIELLTINYYDDYDFDRAGANTTATSYGINSVLSPKGLTTGSKVKVLGTSDWITTVTYYDDKARSIYTYSKNDYLGTTSITDIVKIKLDDFTGRVLETTTEHTKDSNATITTVDHFEYDHTGRLLSQTQDLSNAVSRRLVKNNYDELGQLESKLIDNGTQDGYKDLVGTSVLNDIISTTAANGWGNSGLATSGSFIGDGYVEYEIPQSGQFMMIGISSDNSSASYGTIDFAIYHHSTSNIYVYESGSNKGFKTTYQVGDIFRVERLGSTIHYKKNGEIFYTSANQSTGILLGDVAFHTNQGMVKDLKIVDNTKGLQQVDYTYNVRGWLKNINQDTHNDNDLFNFTLMYNDIADTTKKLYNGNISQTSWNTLNIDSSIKTYTYTYDALDRIVSAVDNTNNYSLSSISYDKNGNVMSLNRRGHTNVGATNFGVMDDLTYSYDSGNKLMKVADAAPIDQFGFKDDALNTIADTVDDYTYDVNGNMKTNTNRGITNILYNHLNLPTQVTVNGQNINYTYDAIGTRLKKVAGSKTVEYAGSFIYENSTLKHFKHPEGYVEPDGSGFRYVYSYLDHLGNIRLNYSDLDGNGTISTSEILDEKNYYPFGLEHKGYNNVVNGTENNFFNYNGKELNKELGLEWLDYGVRNYDPAIGRWMNIDPLAEVMYDQSTYNYAFNNPILFIDPDGALPWPIHIRSFISAKSVGGGTFRGDGRGASTQSSPNATSRVESSFTVDPAKGTVTDLASRSDATIFYGTGPGGLPPMAKTPEPSSSISNVTTYDTKSAVSLDFEHSAKDPITPSLVTPDLDVQASLDVIENLGKDGSGLLSVTGTFTGDAFPSTEAFITDQSGKTQLLFGAHKEEGGLGKLFGENKRPTFTVNMMINVDKNGNFTGVTQGDKTYTVKEWNQKVKDEFY